MLYIVGPMPPPVHGAAAVTEAVAKLCQSENLPIVVLDTAPASRSLVGHHFSRLAKYLRAAGTLLTSGKGRVYCSLSGGLGLGYDLMLVLIARLRQQSILFHHHSFAYLNQRSLFMAAIVRAAGPSALHITLSPTMQRRLVEMYGPDLQAETVSNLAFLPAGEPDPDRPTERTFHVIGYLSNVSREKGIDRFLDIVQELRARGSAIEARIAGPIADPDLKVEVERRGSELGGVTLLGPLYGDRKTEFLRSIDLLVFPTRYTNEAQPLVLFEALFAGVPVVATQRGCMPDLPKGPAVILLDRDANDIEPLIAKLLALEQDASLFATILAAAVKARKDLALLGAGDRQKAVRQLAQGR